MIGEVESVDEVEIIRRMTEGIYDRTEYKKALAWVKEKCRPDFDNTENDTLNATSMLFMKLLTGRAQMFADVRTYWSGESVKRVTGYELEGHAKENVCEDDIYRPAAWNAFGMDKEGQGYRACEAYGPMYKNIRK